MLSENSVDWKPCWWKNNGDDNSLRVKTVEMLNMLRVKSNRLVDRKPMWCKTVEILWQCWLNPTPPFLYIHVVYPGYYCTCCRTVVVKKRLTWPWVFAENLDLSKDIMKTQEWLVCTSFTEKNSVLSFMFS